MLSWSWGDAQRLAALPEDLSLLTPVAGDPTPLASGGSHIQMHSTKAHTYTVKNNQNRYLKWSWVEDFPTTMHKVLV